VPLTSRVDRLYEPFRQGAIGAEKEMLGAERTDDLRHFVLGTDGNPETLI